MIEALRCNGVEVIECHEQLWHSIDDRVEIVEGGWLSLRFWRRLIRSYINLIQKYRKVGNYDVLIVGYPGQLDVAIARILSWFHRKPLVWDIFMSIYLIALERGLEQKNHFIVNLIRLWEKIACRIPDLLIIDTMEYAKWFQENHGITTNRFKFVPTGADDRVFKPQTFHQPKKNHFTVVYYGTFIPNHGVLYIAEAAKILCTHKDIHFSFIGEGPDRQQAIEFVENNSLINITFIEWLNQESLIKHMAQADISLGAFGTTPQSLMTVQNKIYEGLALKLPVISGESPAINQSFVHKENIYLCDRTNPESLVHAILDLYSDSTLRKKIAEKGYAEYQNKYSLEKLGERYLTHLSSLPHRYQ
jgi:glycosyltransferase involved in cell wall biosynthesis